MFTSERELARQSIYRDISAGPMSLAYNDQTHLEPTDWRSLLNIEILDSGPITDEDSEVFYKITKAVDARFEASEGFVVEDSLALSLGRSGFIAPIVDSETLKAIIDLKKADGIVLIPDSNVLYNGSLHWILRILGNSSVWLLPFVVSLTQLQQKDAMLKSLLRDVPKKANLKKALRSRAFINSSFGLLERNRRRYQVVELEPSLLRYLRGGSKSGSDPDESDVLEDRLLVEGIHAVLRTMRTRALQVVLTSDVMLSRILRAEGIRHLFVPPPKLTDVPLNCIRYDPLTGGFCGAPLRTLLCELAQTFGSIRLERNAQPLLTLSTYWPQKTAVDWSDEVLKLELPLTVPQASRIAAESGRLPASHAAGSAPATGGARARPGATMPSAEPAATGRNARPAVPEIGEAFTEELSGAALPQASLQQVLRMAGAALEWGPGTADDLLSALPAANRPGAGIAKRALEILRRMGAISLAGRIATATQIARDMERLLAVGDLDALSKVFDQFEPYASVAELLRERAAVERDEIEPWLSQNLDAFVAKEASIRLARYHVMLGQAWTDGSRFFDGSARPADAVFISGFMEVFAAHAQDGLAKVSLMLPDLSAKLRMSPWATAGRIGILAEGGLRNFSFQPAAGGKPVGGDPVIAGSLLDSHLQSVPTDRLIIGGRPVLTIGAAQ